MSTEDEREALSDNHFSADDQTRDAIDRGLTPDQRASFSAEFPEWDTLQWEGSWVDTDASGVDPEYTSWVRDWLESHTAIQWDDGEPYLYADE